MGKSARAQAALFALVCMLAFVACNNDQDQAIAAAASSAAAKVQAAAELQAIAAAASSAAAAQSDKDKATAAAAAAAKVQAAAELRADVQQHPDKYLTVSNEQPFDKGIINSYRQLATMTVLNRSQFALANLSGSVNWLDATGSSAGTTPFSLSGSIPAGATVTFSTGDGTMTSGTLQAKANGVRITFAPATIVSP